MTWAFGDRVKETTQTTGTGTLSLAGAQTQFQTFVAGVGSGKATYYCLLSGNGTDWETGIGTVTSGTPATLSRDTVLASSAAGAKISLTGTSVVFGTPLAAMLGGLPKITVLNSGSGTFTRRNTTRWIRRRGIGAGGGGGGSGSGAGLGTDGGSTTCGSLTASGGTKGGTVGGSGGSASGGNVINARGGSPAQALPPNSVGPSQFPLGGACVLGPGSIAASLPPGVGGAGGANSTTIASGGGGGGGGYFEDIDTDPPSTYSYAIGAHGVGGGAGTGGSPGGNAGDGQLIIEEYT